MPVWSASKIDMSTPRCCVLVPGTRINPFERSGRWQAKWSALRGQIAQQAPNTTFVEFPWTRHLSQRSRHVAAERLARMLATLRHSHKDIAVIAHSHGGNVAIQAIQLAGLDDIRLVTLGTPFLTMTNRSFEERSRWMIATTVALVFLLVGFLIYVPYIGSNALPLLLWLLWLFAYLGVVLSSPRWVPTLQRHLEGYINLRRRYYEFAELNRPVPMLVVYHEAYDEADIALRTLRARTLSASHSFSRHHRVASAIVLRSTSMRYPAICFFCALALVVLLKVVSPSFWAENSVLFMVTGGLDLAFASLTIFWVVWIMLPGGLSAGVALWHLAISASLWSFYARVHAGNPLDLLAMGVTTHAKPRIKSEWRHLVSFVRLRHGSESFLGRLYHRLSRGPFHSMYSEPVAFQEICDWIVEGGAIAARS